ncbi:MAG: beta-glucuronidase [Chitinophagaceae bacterium]|nr:beta-glucuronidase [Chitinophagaceae bacterium]
MIRALLLTTICLSLFISSFSQTTTIQNIQGRKILSLNGRWNFTIDPYENGYYDYRHKPFDESASGTGGFYDDKKSANKTDLIEYNFDLSPTLRVPADWNSQADKLEFYEGTVWYRQKFTLSRQQEKKYILYFGAVNYEAHVYLNGKKLGMHKGGFTPFQFDITDKIQNGENTVIVKADNSRKQDEIPTVNTDWWNYGGITRDVFVAELPASYISDYKVQLAKADTTRLNGYVQLSDAKKNEKVIVLIPEAGIHTTVITDDSGRAVINTGIKQLKLWSPQSPKLYKVSLIHEQDTLNDMIGFRTIEVKGQNILLNGKSIFLSGISLHDENPMIPGRLRSQGDMRMMLQWAKELNCNYVRLAHYPHNEEMIRLADEMGLLVWAEIPVYWTISWENAGTYNNAQQQLTDLVMRDKNRASVIIWSAGNETPVSEQRNIFMSKLVDHARALDNTRLVAAALEVHRQGEESFVNDPLGEKIDLASFNEYAGWYWGGTPSEITKYSFNIKYNKPVIISEFGGDALAGFHADENTRWSEEYQAALYKNQFILLNKVPGLRGMTPWILCDFRSPRRQQPYYQDYFNRKGLISETGKKKMAFDVLKTYYQKIQQQYGSFK